MTTVERHEYVPRDSRSRRDETGWKIKEEIEHDTWILAWWKDHKMVLKQGGEGEETVHIYKTHIRPSRPLVVGERARIFAMPRAAPTAPGTRLHDYKAYDPHVYGEIEEIGDANEGWVKVKIRNLCKGNAITMVELDVIHAPGKTVRAGSQHREAGEQRWRLEEPQPACIAHLEQHGSRGSRGRTGRQDARSGRGETRGAEPHRWNLTRHGEHAVGGRSASPLRRATCGAHPDTRDDSACEGETERSGRERHHGGTERRKEAGDRERERTAGRMTCGAEACLLEPRQGHAGRTSTRTWGVMDARVRRDESTQSLEGELKMHMWLRYDWAK